MDINFVGVIITNENVTLADKKKLPFAVKIAGMFGVDGLVISEEGFGNPDADLIMNCRRAEMAGMKTVLITDEFAGQGRREPISGRCCGRSKRCSYSR